MVERVLAAPAVRADIEPYISPATGKIINSRSQRKDDLKASGSIEWEPGLRPYVERRRQEAIREDEVKIEKTVDEIVTAMNVAGRLD